jgi:hypothetical protein
MEKLMKEKLQMENSTDKENIVILMEITMRV